MNTTAVWWGSRASQTFAPCYKRAVAAAQALRKGKVMATYLERSPLHSDMKSFYIWTEKRQLFACNCESGSVLL